MLETIDITMIDPNPYQTREHEDPEHIQKIALSVATEGLLQNPVGRLVDCNGKLADAEVFRGNTIEMLIKAGWRVQLAFGHSRLAAYKLMAEIQHSLNGALVDPSAVPYPEDLVKAMEISRENGADFDEMPVNIRELDDEEMFRLGVGENLARKDLTPLEEARAMAVYRDTFQKTSTEIGQLFGLAESSVRGKLRILQLPADLQKELLSRNISEGVMRELVTWFDLPDVVDKNQRSWYRGGKSQTVVEYALDGATAEDLSRAITSSIGNKSREFGHNQWRIDYEIPGSAGDTDVVGLCKGCAFRLARDKKYYCLKAACYDRKEQLWKLDYLRQASLLSGYQVHEEHVDFQYSGMSDFGYRGTQELEVARSARCENLCLVYEKKESYRDGFDRVADFPDARIICKKRNGFCTCQNALKAGVDLVHRAAEIAKDTPEGSEASFPVGTGLTSDDLKQITREVRQQKRQDLGAIRFLVDKMAGIFMHALEAGNIEIFRLILEEQTYSRNSKKTPANEVVFKVALHLVQRIYSDQSYEPTAAEAVKRYNAALTAAGLPELDGVPGVEPDKDEAPVGKTLAEVFEEQP